MRLLKPIYADNGFVIVPVHYSHDPEKSHVEWTAREQAKYQREAADWERVWNQEMELDFTAVYGSPAYPNFSRLNIRDDLKYDPQLPLCLCCDFNIEPMVWEVAQIQTIQGVSYPCFLDEIVMSPGTIQLMVDEFRNRYPDHPAEVWIYGDATGINRNNQTGHSCYDMLRLSFRGYSSVLRFRVPPKNPDVRDRLNSVNLKLRDHEGKPGLFVHPKCTHLIKDFLEVITKEDGTKIVKETRKENPYFWRTHASDAAGYFIYREWPVRREVLRVSSLTKPRPKPQYRRVLGDM